MRKEFKDGKAELTALIVMFLICGLTALILLCGCNSTPSTPSVSWGIVNGAYQPIFFKF